MTRIVRQLTIAGTAAVAVLAAATAGAQPDRRYGAEAPFTIEDLPPGLLRSGLEGLPSQAQSRALDWLHTFTFPAADAATLRVDPGGGVFYVDPQAAATGTGGTSTAPQALSVTEVFALHSRPGASKVIYIDVDGHVITGTAWNQGAADPLYAKAFDTDGDSSTFSAAERDAIAEIWHRIAEDYAPFDVDVTTEEPVSFGPQTGRLLVTNDEDLYNNPMPAQGAGGVAYVNVFGRSNYDYYSPALVYADNLGPFFPPYIAEAAAHEMGHNLGLSHDGTSTSSYYGGHGSGWVSWGPIMGTGYNDNVSQWSQGEYSGANNPEDDLAIIGAKLATRGDDHGDTQASATLLAVAGDGTVVATNPQTDPFNVNPANKGIVNSRTDVDMFTFSAGAGTIDLTVTPSWAAWPRSSGGRGTNLDVQATLYDLNGAIVAVSDPLDNTDATISVAVGGGDYYLAVTGVGNSISPYTDYGSQGQYFIAGFVPAGTPDTQPPSPDPMGWSSLPAAAGADRISMTAVTASDDSGGTVQYYFVCVAGGGGCADSGWQTLASYTATGLDPDTAYSWQVKARDLAGNETGLSPTASATTDVAPQPPAAPTGLTAADGADGTAVLNWTDASADETGFEVVRESWQSKRNRWQSTTLVATTAPNVTTLVDASGSGLYRYRIRATNAIGPSAYTPWVEVDVTGGGKSGGGGGSCKGGPKKCG